MDNLAYDTCILVEDFKKKLEEMEFREPLCNFFGKSGLSVYGAMVIFKERIILDDGTFEDKMSTIFLEKLCNEAKEDSVLASADLQLCLKDIHQRYPHISKRFAIFLSRTFYLPVVDD